MARPFSYHTCALALGSALLATAAHAATTAQGGVQSSVLLKTQSSWDGTRYLAYPAGSPELTVVKISIPAHTELAWHQHPMPNAAYILSGELTVETLDGEHRKVIKQGEVLAEMVGRRHRGTTGATPAELVVFYAGQEGMPLSK